MQIALVTALPQEHGAVSKMIGSWHPYGPKSLRMFRSTVSGKEIILLETGMGREPVQTALRNMLRVCRPHLLVSSGFAGSLTETCSVGDILLGERFLYMESLHGTMADECFQVGTSETFAPFCDCHGVRRAQMLTLPRPEAKTVLSRLFCERPTAIDMESYFVARFGMERGIPVLCLRGVSDGLHDEIDFDPRDISDSHGRIHAARVMHAVCRKPALVRSFYRLWRRSGRVGEELGKVLYAFLDLSTEYLETLAAESRVRASISLTEGLRTGTRAF